MKVVPIFQDEHFAHYLSENGDIIKPVTKIAQDTEFHPYYDGYYHIDMLDLTYCMDKSGDDKFPLLLNKRECNYCGGSLKHGSIIKRDNNCKLYHEKCPKHMAKARMKIDLKVVEKFFSELPIKKARE